MADISKIKLNGSYLNIKDSVARSSLATKAGLADDNAWTGSNYFSKPVWLSSDTANASFLIVMQPNSTNTLANYEAKQIQFVEQIEWEAQSTTTNAFAIYKRDSLTVIDPNRIPSDSDGTLWTKIYRFMPDSQNDSSRVILREKDVKTINGVSLIGSGDLQITVPTGTIYIDPTFSPTSTNPVQAKGIADYINAAFTEITVNEG